MAHLLSARPSVPPPPPPLPSSSCCPTTSFPLPPTHHTSYSVSGKPNAALSWHPLPLSPYPLSMNCTSSYILAVLVLVFCLCPCPCPSLLTTLLFLCHHSPISVSGEPKVRTVCGSICLPLAIPPSFLADPTTIYLHNNIYTLYS